MISIIIVGYNSRKYLQECFESIFLSTYKKFRVIFVDNNSTDDSVKYLRGSFPAVKVIESKENLGFAAGNNVGIKKAIEEGTDFIFLLNPDTIIDKDCLDNLVRKTTPDTVLQPLILLNENDKNTNLINTTGGHLNFLGFSYCSDYKKDRTTAIEKDIAIASGAAVLIPKEILQKIGLFDESFFMYHEDVDLFWRARLSGYNIRLIPDSIVWHKYSFSKNKKKLFYADRNRMLFLYKNFSIKYRMLILPAFVINEIWMLLYSLLSGWFLPKIQTYFSFVKLSLIEHKECQTTMRTVTVKEHDLKQFIKPELSFSELNNPLFTPYNFILKLYWRIIYPSI